MEIRPTGGRRGFTLVELLVSAGLVMLMMMLFAQIFQLATATLATQRGIAENDQRARMLTTMLSQDLRWRTFQDIVAFDPRVPALPHPNRHGYFYISENDPDSDLDDVLQFTVALLRSQPSPSPTASAPTDVLGDQLVVEQKELLFFGRATPLAPSSSNQPDLDGDGSLNFSAASAFAEVTYFLRRGNLYRRVMLIRPRSGGSAQPHLQGVEYFHSPSNPDPTGTVLVYSTPPNNTRVFYREFDFSVYRANFGGFEQLKFHGNDSLFNDGASASSQFMLGRPWYRFGHNYTTGQPREFINDSSGLPTVFMGRFTHDETSHDDFQYPFLVAPSEPGYPNPYTRTDLTDLTGTTGGPDGTIDQYAGTSALVSRRAEDIIMTQAHGFDVKVWDDAVGRFVDIGHSIPGGDFYQTPEGSDPTSDTQNRNWHSVGGINYGPRVPAAINDDRNRIFDTWHTQVDINGDATMDPPPFRPTRPPGAPLGTPLPMRAIQITVRYYDPSSDQTRQLTLVEDLLVTDLREE
ncbi:MAG: hypothetical protein KY476_06765 [Planctomycetes bacterium]|nr:hypothetical protein [Planctomycetota bacterium]